MASQRLRFAPLRPVPPGLWRRVPPAIFPPLLGLAGLAMAWRGAAQVLGMPPALAEGLSGAVVALALFAFTAYGAKLARRPAVLVEELATLPGRAGVAAGVLTLYLTAVLIGLHAPAAGRGLLILGLALHAGFAAVLVRVLATGPAEARRVTPVWHLSFVGLVVAARAALPLSWPGLAQALVWPSLAMAAAIYAASLRQLLAERVPAPLRPMLAIHLAPMALFGMVAAGLGWSAAAWGFGLATLAGVAALAAGARWLLAAGFSPFWGALTFPLAASAGLWTVLAGMAGAGPARVVAAVLVAVATLVVLPVAFLIWRGWAQGRLPARTNAAIA